MKLGRCTTHRGRRQRCTAEVSSIGQLKLATPFTAACSRLLSTYPRMPQSRNKPIRGGVSHEVGGWGGTIEQLVY